MNMYANCISVTEVIRAFDTVTSPENLTCDGELSTKQVQARLRKIYDDLEPALAHFGQHDLGDYGMNATPAEAAVIAEQGWNTDSLLTIVSGWDPTKGTRLHHMVRVAAEEVWTAEAASYLR